MAAEPLPPSRAGSVAVLLSFVAGYVDTVGFVALYGLFTAHVTGNLVLLGASLVHSHAGYVAKLTALPLFVLVVALATWYADRRARQGRDALTGMLCAQILLLAGFASVGTWAAPIVDADAPAALLAGLLGVAAMAFQNAGSRLLLGELPPTTVMTGGVTQFAIDITRLLQAPRGPGAPAVRARLRKFLPPVLAFAAGAAGGALAYVHAGFPVLGLPIAALVAVLALSRAAPAVGLAGDRA